MNNEVLNVSEHFYSIQGEGPSAGRPAVFLRLKSCNLLCGGAGTEKDKCLHDGAKWRCDTIETWLHGEKFELEKLGEIFDEQGYIEKLRKGAHLIITGGEPLLQVEGIMEFLELLYVSYGLNPYTEVETNGTIFSENLFFRLNQVNCSPKLSTSGMPKGKRYREQALSLLAELKKCFFKFVISDYADWAEIETDFIQQFNIDPRRIYLMPAASTREELWAMSMLCAELAKQHLCNFSTRLQVEIWNQTTGV